MNRVVQSQTLFLFHSCDGSASCCANMRIRIISYIVRKMIIIYPLDIDFFSSCHSTLYSIRFVRNELYFVFMLYTTVNSSTNKKHCPNTINFNQARKNNNNK